MDVSEDVTGTLRAQEHGHPPCVMEAAGFCTEHSANARSIGYEEERSPTLRAGVVPAAIALENHPMNMVFNVSTLMHLRNAVGDIIGLNLDPSHLFFMGGDPMMIARKLCEEKAIYHVHGKDTRLNDHIKGLECFELGAYNGPAVDRVWNYVAVGYGHDHLWWKEFFATLAMGDYHGPVCIEVEDPSMPNNLVAIQKSAKFLKETMLS